MADHVLLPRVVGGQREREVSLEGVEHGAQVAGPRVDVLVGVVGIADAHDGSGRGHELHEALGSLLGDRGVIEVGLHGDHRGDERFGQAVTLGGRLDVVGDSREIVLGRRRLVRLDGRFGQRDGTLEYVRRRPRCSRRDEHSEGERGTQ